MDTREDAVRWKLTDDPAPGKKKPPDENQGHKRKKEPVPEAGVKKKVIVCSVSAGNPAG